MVPYKLPVGNSPQHVQTPEALTVWQGALWYKPRPRWGHASEITQPKHAGSCDEGCTVWVMELHALHHCISFSKDMGWCTSFLDRNLRIHQLLPFHWVDESYIP